MATKCAYCGGIRSLKGNCPACGAREIIATGRMTTGVDHGLSTKSVLTVSTLAVACIWGGCQFMADRETAMMMAPIKGRQIAALKANLAVITEAQRKLQGEATKARSVKGGAARLDANREAEERAESIANEFKADLLRIEKES